MQTPDFGEDPSPAEDVLAENGHDNTSLDSTEPYVPPRIPLGLPHVVHFVEASLWHLPQTIRTVGERMSRYADKDGKASIALPFLCEIAGLGSKNTAEHAIAVMASMGVLAKHPGKGGKDRKSNTYTFLGKERNWRPLPVERRGTNPWIALSKSRRENEALRAENEALKSQMTLLTNGHSAVTDGERSTEPDSYESKSARGTDRAIGHSEVTDGQVPGAPEPASHSYEKTDPGSSPGTSKAISHSKVTDGSDESPGVPGPSRPGGGAGHGAPGLLRPKFQRGGTQRRPPFLPQRRKRTGTAPPDKRDQGRSGTRFLRSRGRTRTGKTAPPRGKTDGIRPQGGGVLPGLQQSLHHVQRGGTVPRLHQPPPQGE